MFQFQTILFLFSLILATSAQTRVWNVENEWNEKFELIYSKWIESDSVDHMIFFRGNSPIQGVKVDCADAAFALRILFAYQNRLPFKIKNPKGKGFFSEQMNRFNHLNEVDRVKAFASFIGDSVGTENLAAVETYPIGLASVRAGDLYINKWKTGKSWTRHAYIIKRVLPTGHLELYSATTPAATRPMSVRKGFPGRYFEKSPWGFRRFKNYSLGTSANRYEFYSNEQYQLNKQLSSSEFFSKLRRLNESEEDTYDKNFRRRVENACIDLQSRVFIVEEAKTYHSGIGRCMNSSEYDNYSTPSRDKNLFKSVVRLANGWVRMKKLRQRHLVNEEMALGLNYLIRTDKSEAAKKALYDLCPVLIPIDGKNYKMDLWNFYQLKKKGRLSSNPNDSISSRWGLRESQTYCPRY